MRPEGVFARAAVEELIRLSPHVPHMREALDRMEAQGIIVVVDELPAAPAPGLRQATGFSSLIPYLMAEGGDGE